ncbi:MAG: AAC(3) family N-acetyltransferase [Anaerolineales bacterium]|nr:AAC(3) family N-acetyltransferase [Anaerolineales bacterium]
MTRFRDCIHTFREIGLTGRNHLIVHCSPSPPAGLHSGFETMLAALLESCESLITPAFTPQTMIIPEVGPDHNAIRYGQHYEHNRQADFFNPALSSTAFLEPFVSIVRSHPQAVRSDHPLLSFVGIHAEKMLESQSVLSPFEPIRTLAELDGDILLIGTDHTANTSIHYAEQVAGRRSFTRWALTHAGAVTCPGYPGCPEGFNALRPQLDAIVRSANLGSTMVSLIPARDLIQAVVGWIHVEPAALLCSNPDCEFCIAVHAQINADHTH